MLVLTRKPDEQIVIGEGSGQIILRVLRVHGDKVVLGIAADRDIPIHREELLPDRMPARFEETQLVPAH